jgi:hypothetical protein
MKMRRRTKLAKKTVSQLVVAFVLGAPASSWAKELCQPAAELRTRVVYCDQNFDYYEAAKVCKDRYLAHVEKEQKRIKGLIAAQAALSTDSSQKEKLEHSRQILSSAITELDSLIHQGKEVHTEIEDYVYDLVLPAFNEAEARANLEDPRVKAEFMRRECYGDPHTQMELMQKEIRPVVSDLEKALAEAVALQELMATRSSNLDSLGQGPVTEGPATQKRPAEGKAPKGKSQRSSDISGTEKKKP